MEYDYSKLKGRIVEKFGTNYNFTKALGLSHVSLSAKLNNKIAFTQREIDKSCGLLGIKETEISDYFFVKVVQKN